jgi:hypothetical protein
MPEDTRTGEPSPDQWPDHWTVERLLADPETARDTAEQDLATLFAALRAPAEPHELARERDHLAAFDAARALETAPVTSRRRSMLASLLAGKTAAAAVAACAVATGAGAVTGTLPHGLQQAAHDAVGAPAPDKDKPAKEHQKGKADTAKDKPRPSVSPTTTPGGPDLSGPARRGLCNAFRHGGLAKTSVAYRSLSDAAGGPSRIPTFCDIVAPPKETGKPSDKPNDKSTGKPADKPGNGKPGDDEKGNGKPTDRPAPRPSTPAAP